MTLYFGNENAKFNNFLLNQIKEYKELNNIIDIVKYSKEGDDNMITKNKYKNESV